MPRQTNSNEDQNFCEELPFMGLNIDLGKVFEYIAAEYGPEDVFDTDQLQNAVAELPGESDEQEYIDKLEDTLEVFRKIVVIDGKEYAPGLPLCAGCDELTVARGMECYYKRLTTECKYPEEVLNAVKQAKEE